MSLSQFALKQPSISEEQSSSRDSSEVDAPTAYVFNDQTMQMLIDEVREADASFHQPSDVFTRPIKRMNCFNRIIVFSVGGFVLMGMVLLLLLTAWGGIAIVKAIDHTLTDHKRNCDISKHLIANYDATLLTVELLCNVIELSNSHLKDTCSLARQRLANVEGLIWYYDANGVLHDRRNE